ncbi:hypothetical protein OOK31_20590 [Streptomyces sp. NBC_00249]|uniref:hypothetical protein n=1 Tax=Streptomyces sp. NBC_00249 TaxID=2975690 RepID=UPI00225A8826|nr:hypothetical protein [Streptomyces sp. NBC_00249]MCX5196265.1 hypothetical protein [Streptomyces sp. NBC_00249]
MSPTTGTTGTIRHPEVSEISDLTEGLLSPSRTAEVRRHLGDCALCADVRASLDEIRSLLGTLPGPPRMPSSVAGRIDAALAAEALLDSTASRATATAGRGTDSERPDAGDLADGDVSRETSPASAAAPAGRAEVHRPSGHPSGPSGPGRRRARRRIAVVAGLAGAAACALGVLLFTGLGTDSTHDTASQGVTTSHDPSSSSARSSDLGGYTAEGMQEEVRRLLVPGNGTNKTMGLDNASPGLAPSDRQAPPESAAVPPCVQQATGRTDTPLASELGSYQGTPGYLVLLPHPGDPALVDAYVVAAACADTPSAAPGKPLLTGTYPRT